MRSGKVLLFLKSCWEPKLEPNGQMKAEFNLWNVGLKWIDWRIREPQYSMECIFLSSSISLFLISIISPCFPHFSCLWNSQIQMLRFQGLESWLCG